MTYNYIYSIFPLDKRTVFLIALSIFEFLITLDDSLILLNLLGQVVKV